MLATARRRELVAFLGIALVWFWCAVFVVPTASPPLPAIVPAILPAGALVNGLFVRCRWEAGPGPWTSLPLMHLSLAAHALHWAAFSLALGAFIRRPSVWRVFRFVAVASYPLLALPELLRGDISHRDGSIRWGRPSSASVRTPWIRLAVLPPTWPLPSPAASSGPTIVATLLGLLGRFRSR